MRNPSGIFRRIVKSPVEAVGSPSSTANCAPGRTIGGAGTQGMVCGVNALFSCALSCAALVNASPAQENIPAAARVRNKYRFIVEPPSFVAQDRTAGIMSWAEGYSNEERIPLAYLFYIVANC